MDFVENYSTVYVDDSSKVEIDELAEEIEATGVKKMDALHVSCAIHAGADYLLTTDDRLLKYKSDSIIIEDPIAFSRRLEVKNGEE